MATITTDELTRSAALKLVEQARRDVKFARQALSDAEQWLDSAEDDLFYAVCDHPDYYLDRKGAPVCDHCGEFAPQPEDVIAVNAYYRDRYADADDLKASGLTDSDHRRAYARFTAWAWARPAYAAS